MNLPFYVVTYRQIVPSTNVHPYVLYNYSTETYQTLDEALNAVSGKVNKSYDLSTYPPIDTAHIRLFKVTEELEYKTVEVSETYTRKVTKCVVKE